MEVPRGRCGWTFWRGAAGRCRPRTTCSPVSR